MEYSKISQNGQTTIPAKIREYLQVGPSDNILYRVEEGKVVLEGAPSSAALLYGSLKTDRPPPTKDELRQARAAYYKKKYSK